MRMSLISILSFTWHRTKNQEPARSTLVLGSWFLVLELAAPLARPALDHHLGLGVELHAMAALGVQIAEEALLPAREREEGHWRGHADVDADIAGARLAAKLACRRAA